MEAGDYILQWSTDRMDITGLEVYEGDVIKSHLGGRILALNMVVKQAIRHIAQLINSIWITWAFMYP